MWKNNNTWNTHSAKCLHFLITFSMRGAIRQEDCSHNEQCVELSAVTFSQLHSSTRTTCRALDVFLAMYCALLNIQSGAILPLIQLLWELVSSKKKKKTQHFQAESCASQVSTKIKKNKTFFECGQYRIRGYLYWPAIWSALLVRNLGMATVHWSNLTRYADDLSDHWDHLGL